MNLLFSSLELESKSKLKKKVKTCTYIKIGHKVHHDGNYSHKQEVVNVVLETLQFEGSIFRAIQLLFSFVFSSIMYSNNICIVYTIVYII